jgi:hypothetical protein
MSEREEEIGVYLLLGLVALKQTICSYFEADIDTVIHSQPASQQASDILLQ